MARSFSLSDATAVLKGTTLLEMKIDQLTIVDEDPGPAGPAIWLVDLLDDVGVSLTPAQVPAVLPVLQAWATQHGAVFKPVPMVLHCPRCGRQQIDEEESEVAYQARIQDLLKDAEGMNEPPPRWTNPPHKSHACHYCKPTTIWRPAPFETIGVERIESRGKADNWPPIGTINLIVNGEPMICSMEDRQISYEDVVDLLAYQKFPTQRPREFLWTITYHSQYRSGTLSPGRSVEVDEGLRFTAVITSGA